MKIPSPAYAIGALGVLAFLGEMNKRGYYGSTFGYGSSNAGSRAWKDIPDKYRKMSSGELRKLAASGDSVAAQAYEEKQMAYDAFHAQLEHDERRNERGSAARGATISDADREQWIDNDEGLYDDYRRWARRNAGGKRAYVKAHRDELDAVIRNVRDGARPAHYLKYGV